ncbi:MAG: hypothetical protein QME42_01555 [bacterium]|nr:hypothetical protein [bacterium]
MSVGQELLDVPFPEMVTKLAIGIAKGQEALDKNSVATAKELAEETITVIPSITRTIKENGTVEYKNADGIVMSLLQVGLYPTFYQFSEATIEVSMDIKTKSEKKTSVDVKMKAKVGFACWSASIAVDVKHSRQFSKEVHGTSRLFVKMVPVPPPERFFPQIETVDLRPEPEA